MAGGPVAAPPARPCSGTCASASHPGLHGWPTAPAHAARLGFHRASTGTFNPVFGVNWPTRTSPSRTASWPLPESLIDQVISGHAGARVVPQGEGPAAPGGAFHCRRPRHRTAGWRAASALADFQWMRCAPTRYGMRWSASQVGGTIETAAQRYVGGPPGRFGGCGRQAAALPTAGAADAPADCRVPMPACGGAGGAAGDRTSSAALRTPAERNGRPARRVTCWIGTDLRGSARRAAHAPLCSVKANGQLDAAQSPPPRLAALARPMPSVHRRAGGAWRARSALGALAQLWRDTPATAAIAQCQLRAGDCARLDRVQSPTASPPRVGRCRLLFHGAH